MTTPSHSGNKGSKKSKSRSGKAKVLTKPKSKSRSKSFRSELRSAYNQGKQMLYNFRRPVMTALNQLASNTFGNNYNNYVRPFVDHAAFEYERNQMMTMQPQQPMLPMTIATQYSPMTPYTVSTPMMGGVRY
jgi:hypothetical protein